jgi:hypothetical protein
MKRLGLLLAAAWLLASPAAVQAGDCAKCKNENGINDACEGGADSGGKDCFIDMCFYEIKTVCLNGICTNIVANIICNCHYDESCGGGILVDEGGGGGGGGGNGSG